MIPRDNGGIRWDIELLYAKAVVLYTALPTAALEYGWSDFKSQDEITRRAKFWIPTPIHLRQFLAGTPSPA